MKYTTLFFFLLLGHVGSAQSDQNCFTEDDVRYVFSEQPEEDKRIAIMGLKDCPASREKTKAMAFLTWHYMVTKEAADMDMIEELFLYTRLGDYRHFYWLDLSFQVKIDTLTNGELLREYYLLSLAHAGVTDLMHSDCYGLMQDIVKKISGKAPKMIVFKEEILSASKEKYNAYCLQLMIHYKSAGIDENFINALVAYQANDDATKLRRAKLLAYYLSLDTRMHNKYEEARMKAYWEAFGILKRS